MKKNLLSILFICFIFITFGFMAFSPKQGTAINEQRVLATFPEFPKKISSSRIKTYFSAVDRFFIDHFPQRDHLINNYVSYINYITDDSYDLDPSKAYKGKNGWIFLGNYYNRTVDKLIGKLTASDDYIKKASDKFTAYNEILQADGVKTLFILGPDKSRIYSQYLPSIVTPSRERFVAPILQSLKQRGMDIFDPTSLLLSKKDHTLYYRTDTHWNLYAGAIIYKAIAEKLGFTPVSDFSLEPAQTIPGDIVSIGLYQFKPTDEIDTYKINWQKKPQLLYSKDGDVYEPASENVLLTFENKFIRNPNAPIKKTLWVIGDSFSVALLPYLTATFENVRCFTYLDVTPQLIKEALQNTSEKPSYTIFMVVERQL